MQNIAVLLQTKCSKRFQNAARNNAAICCTEMLRAFGQAHIQVMSVMA